MLSRRSLKPSSINFASSRAIAVAPGEMRRANRGCEMQVLADRQLLVECVLLRDVTDVALERVEVFVKRLAVQQDFAATRLKLSAEHAHERAFAGPARAHHADQLAAIDREADAFERDVAVREPMVDVEHLEAADDVALFLDDPLGKIAAEKLPDIDADGVAVSEGSGRAHRVVADHDRAVGLQHLQGADAFVVVAQDLQQHIAGGAGREQDIVRL